MSRVAKKPVPLPKGVDCQVKPDAITVKGPKGTLSMAAPGDVDVAIDGGEIRLQPKTAQADAMAGFSSGRSTNRKLRSGAPPAIAALSSSTGSICIMLPPTVRTA